jgi:hypothetical protein
VIQNLEDDLHFQTEACTFPATLEGNDIWAKVMVSKFTKSMALISTFLINSFFPFYLASLGQHGKPFHPLPDEH